MELGQLQLLCAVADHGSVTEAAWASGRTPSAVSQQLKVLQRDAGLPLVERAGRGVRLTEAGQALAAAARKLNTAAVQLEEEWQAWQQAPRGVVRIAMFPSAAELLAPPLLSRLAHKDDLRLELTDHDVRQDDFAALTASHDIVIAHRGDDAQPSGREDLHVVPLLTEPVEVAMSRRHRLAERESLHTEEVIDEPWLGVPPEFPLDRILAAVSITAGRPARVVQRTEHFSVLEAMAAAGLGVTLLPRLVTMAHHRADLVLVPLADITIRRHVEALVQPERYARRAVRSVLAELGRLGAELGR